MGSLGAPWSPSGFAFAPAFAFNGGGYSSIQSAYVTPLPEFKPRDDEEWQDRAWERIKRAMLSIRV